MYPFFYRPMFEVIEDGWHLFSPAEAFKDLESMVWARLSLRASSQTWFKHSHGLNCSASRLELYFGIPAHKVCNLNVCFAFFGPWQTDEWKLSEVNKDFTVCPSYPSLVIVPKDIDDDTLCKAAAFRHGGRFPVLSYYHKKNGMVSIALLDFYCV